MNTGVLSTGKIRKIPVLYTIMLDVSAFIRSFREAPVLNFIIYALVKRRDRAKENCVIKYGW